MVFQAIVPWSRARRSLPELRSVHSIFDEFWRDFGFAAAGDGTFEPRIDVTETDAEVRLVAELPGLEAGDFKVTVENDVVTIEGEKKIARQSDQEGCFWTERSSGAFERSFRFPFEVDSEAVTGSYRNGVLTVTVAKPEESRSRARTIPVTTS